MTPHALPRLLSPGSKLREVLVAVRGRGGAGSTLADVAAATGYGAHQIAPLVWSLTQTGHLVDLGWRPSPLDPRWRDRVYVTARDAALLAQAAA